MVGARDGRNQRELGRDLMEGKMRDDREGEIEGKH